MTEPASWHDGWEPPPVPPHVPWIGRVTLWTFTLALLAGVTSLALGLVWLVAGDAAPAGLEAALRGTLPVLFGAAVAWLLNLELLFRFTVPDRDVVHAPLKDARVHVALTAFNDEQSIGDAVRDFRARPEIGEIVVVDNRSADATARVAREAGADRVVVEEVRGYGACCMRALAEGARDADVVVLCEGDMTFCASDLPKLLAYLENSDLVLGTRATQELRERGTQMDWLINPANQVVAKLVQMRFWGTRLTDVGCTYRAMRVGAYRRLAPHLRVRGNHFSPHMFIEALRLGMRVMEVPVTFRRRVGASKGVGANKVKAARVALRMLGLIYRA